MRRHITQREKGSFSLYFSLSLSLSCRGKKRRSHERWLLRRWKKGIRKREEKRKKERERERERLLFLLFGGAREIKCAIGDKEKRRGEGKTGNEIKGEKRTGEEKSKERTERAVQGTQDDSLPNSAAKQPLLEGWQGETETETETKTEKEIDRYAIERVGEEGKLHRSFYAMCRIYFAGQSALSFFSFACSAPFYFALLFCPDIFVLFALGLPFCFDLFHHHLCGNSYS